MDIFRAGPALCLFLLAGCGAYKDEGAIDYRKAELHCDANQFTTGGGAECQDNDKLSDENMQIDKNTQGEALRIAKLDRKNVLHPKEKEATVSDSDKKEKKVTFRDGDRIVIRLVSAYIEDFEEGPLSWANDALEGQFIVRGEIAVAVKVTPIPDNGEGQTFSFDFSDNAVDAAEIVFYSDDVRARQFLNFNNMPIYGPDSTKLDGVGIEIWIMELDISGRFTGDLLGAISSLSETNFPKGSPGHAIINSLGATIANSSNQHDTNFLYRLLLEDKKDAHLPHAALEVGHYVLIRERRAWVDAFHNVDTDWSKLVLDENSGRVYKTLSNGMYEEYRDRNYLVISIDKDNSGPDLDINNKTYAAFEEALEKQSANPFIAALVIELALGKLLKAFDEYYEAEEEEEVAKTRRTLIIKFADFWDQYIDYPLSRHLDGETVNDNNLTKAQLSEIANELQIKITEGIQTAETNDPLFTWFSHNKWTGNQTADIRNGLISLIRENARRTDQ